MYIYIYIYIYICICIYTHICNLPPSAPFVQAVYDLVKEKTLTDYRNRRFQQSYASPISTPTPTPTPNPTPTPTSTPTPNPTPTPTPTPTHTPKPVCGCSVGCEDADRLPQPPLPADVRLSKISTL